MDNRPEISLIICTRNRDDMIVDVLNSVDKQTFGRSEFEVLVLDQSTNDKTEQILKKFPDFKYIKLTSEGAAASRNEGIKHSNGKILVYVDDDVYFGEEYLQNIANFFNNPEINPDMVGGKTHIKWLGEKPEWIENELLGTLAYSDYGDTPQQYDGHPKHVPYTCNMAIKKEIAEEVGGFSVFISNVEKKYPINEDIMFALKVKNKDYNLMYNPDMFVFHKLPSSRLTFKYFKEKYFSHGLSDAYLYYILDKFTQKDAFSMLFVHAKRLMAGFLLQFVKKRQSEKYYQILRVYYNFGFIISLIDILKRGNKIKNENS